MSRWFRLYPGTARDDKLVRVAIKSKQPIERVVWVWIAILESAAEINTDGRFAVDPAEIARFLAVDAKCIRAILKQLENGGHIYAGQVIRWDTRQFKSDRSKDRVTEWRAKKKAECNADVTLQKRHCNAPETETETETETDNLPSQERSTLREVNTTREGPFAVIAGGAK